MSSAIQWISQYGNETQEFGFTSVSANASGDVYASGATMGEGFFLSKYASDGNQEWVLSIQETEFNGYFDNKVLAVTDGVLLATGNSLKKFNTLGRLEWESVFSPDFPRLSNISLATDNTGAVYLYGTWRINDHTTDLYIGKFTSRGEVAWEKVIGSQSNDQASRVSVSSQNTINITGFSGDKPLGKLEEGGFFRIEFDVQGEVIGSASLKSQRNPHIFTSLTDTDEEGNAYLLGSNNSNTLLLSKISRQGEEIWTVPLDYAGDEIQGALILGILDNNQVAVGIPVNEKYMGGLTVVVDGNGKEVSSYQFQTYRYDAITDISTGGNGVMLVAGVTIGNLSGNSNLGGLDIFVAKLQLPSGNNLPMGKPTLHGIFKAGQKLRINIDPIGDADNYAGFMPSYHYEWEYSDNGGDTWELLGGADAVDGDAFYTLGKQDVGKLVRGSVSFVDGRGATEILKTLYDLVTEVSANGQEVLTSKAELGYSPTKSVTVPLQYRTSTGDSQLSGLTLNVHYNSSVLTPGATNNGVSDQIPAAITSTKVIQDTNDLDNDPLTDKIIQMVWATFDNSFPNKTLPTTLANVTFNTSSQSKDPVTGEPLTTTLRYTASETASGYDFITNSTTLKATTFTLDVDGDGQVKALTDGLMVIRKLLGPAFDGDALTFKAIGSGATRTTAEIHDYIQSGIDSGLLDVDKNGKTTALTDGLMVIRRLLGPAFDGEALTFKALASDSPYFGPPADFNAVASNIDSLFPTVI